MLAQAPVQAAGEFEDPSASLAIEATAPSTEARDLDARLFRAINLKPGHKDALDPLLLSIMPLGDRTAIAIPLGLYAWGRMEDNKQLRDAGVLTAAALASSALATEGLKGLVARKRPAERFGDAQTRIVGPRAADGRSFPSGHTSNAFAWATVLADLYPKASPAFYGAASAVAFGRVRLGAHYPSDVLVGALVGYMAGRLVVSNRDFLMRRDEPPSGGTAVGVSRQFHF
jgi:membrane-associated phospholipid phosphatase